MDISYEPKVVAFIDLLGFKDLLDSATTADEARKVITLLESALQYVGVFEATPYAETTRMFSDSICVSGAPTADGINWVFWRCITIQAILIEHGLLLRGGIPEGKHYQSTNVIFSEALVTSYFLERDQAKYPRVIVHQAVYDLAKEFGRRMPYPPPSELTMQDHDGALFLDYFRYMQGPCENMLTFVQQHKALIERGAARFANEPRVLSKYRWMADYHNRKAEELSHLDVIPFIDIDSLFAGTDETEHA